MNFDFTPFDQPPRQSHPTKLFPIFNNTFLYTVLVFGNNFTYWALFSASNAFIVLITARCFCCCLASHGYKHNGNANDRKSSRHCFSLIFVLRFLLLLCCIMFFKVFSNRHSLFFKALFLFCSKRNNENYYGFKYLSINGYWPTGSLPFRRFFLV